VRLFVRHARSVSLTRGQDLRRLRDASRRNARGGKQALAELDGLQRGSLVIGASTTPGTYYCRRSSPAFETPTGHQPSRSGSRTHGWWKSVSGRRGRRRGHRRAHAGAGERCVAAGIVDELQLIVRAKHPMARNLARKLSREPLLLREEARDASGHGTRPARGGRHNSPGMELDHTETIKRAVLPGWGLRSSHATPSRIGTVGPSPRGCGREDESGDTST